VPSPTDGFVSRRSKDFGSSSISNRSRTTVERHQDSEVVRTSQSEMFRHGTRSLISPTVESGWDQTIEDFNDEEERETATTTTSEKTSRLSGLMSTKSTKVEKQSPEIRSSFYSTPSSSSFYNQPVPGIDDEHNNRFGDSKSPKPTGVSLSKKSDDGEEYDPYGPMASRHKSSDKDSLSFSSSSMMDTSESMVEHTKRISPSVSIKSSTMGAQISHRHDHGIKGMSMMSSLGESNSLLDDIAGIAAEKKSSQAASAKSGSWSFGSWMSSAVAAATETIDKAYESLDPEYSRLKKGGGDGSGGPSGSMSPELGDPDSLSPFKKPG
ncbi:hypothetical protein BGW38_009082, partial [Lunasporangiospora selenospora]